MRVTTGLSAEVAATGPFDRCTAPRCADHPQVQQKADRHFIVAGDDGRLYRVVWAVDFGWAVFLDDEGDFHTVSHGHLTADAAIATLILTDGPGREQRTRGGNWGHANIADPGLRAALLHDDEMENRGMHADDRQTCHGCQTWATGEHDDSPEHAAMVSHLSW